MGNKLFRAESCSFFDAQFFELFLSSIVAYFVKKKKKT